MREFHEIASAFKKRLRKDIRIVNININRLCKTTSYLKRLCERSEAIS